MLRQQIGMQATPGAVLAAATILSLPLGSIYAFRKSASANRAFVR
jgi:hypothetical protein